MKILFFAPHAGVWVHAFPEALVADAIRAGNELVYVTCGGALSSLCVTMASRGLSVTSESSKKLAVCKECRGARDRLRSGLDLPGYDFETMLTSEDRARIESLVAAARPDAVASFEVDGANLGRASLYEFLIERKKLRLELTPEEWSLFRPRLANTVRSFVAAQRILDRERPDRVVVYNSLYSANAAWRAAANQRGIAFYFVHGGLSLHRRLERVLVGRDSTLDWWNRIIAAWPQYRDLPCSPDELAEVTEHFLKLFSGGSVFAYSAPKSTAGVDVRGRFGVAAHQKLLVATMSSYDEYVAAEAVGGVPPQDTLLFPTQIEWVRALVAWMRNQPGRFLLLRVHPREFPNKRDARKSEHAQALERELAELPSNVRINWPSDKLSLYDIAEQADVVLNAWSTAGKEMTLLGLPVVIYSPSVVQYPAELNYVGTTHDAYFAAIEQALADGWSFERIRKAYRWCVLEYLRGLVDIGDGFQFSEEPARSYVERARNLLLSAPAVRQHHDLWRRPPVLRAQQRLHALVASGADTLLEAPAQHAPVPEAVETTALRAEVRRLIQALYPPRRVPADHTLHSRLAAVV